MKLATAMTALFMRTLRETWAGGTGALLPLTYLLGGAALIPLVSGNAIGAIVGVLQDAGGFDAAPTGVGNSELLGLLAPGLLWFLLALSALVTLERIFQSDLEDGSLDDHRLGPLPMELVVVVKVFAVWTLSALPALIILPLPGLFLGLAPMDSLKALPAYCLGSLAFYFWGGVGAALAAAVRRSGLLIAVVVLPFYAPPIIFGAGAVEGVLETGQLDPTALSLLAAATLMSLAVAPIASAQALKLTGEG